jgi:hypothetical protein
LLKVFRKFSLEYCFVFNVGLDIIKDMNTTTEATDADVTLHRKIRLSNTNLTKNGVKTDGLKE